MAGSNSSAHVNLPYRWCSVHHASSAPGADTAIAPSGGITPFFALALTISSVSDLGDRPDPASPEPVGSTSPSTAFAATAASTADPPFFSISIAACVANGCAVPAAPEHPSAGDRVVKLAPAGRSPACTSGRSNLSSPAA